MECWKCCCVWGFVDDFFLFGVDIWVRVVLEVVVVVCLEGILVVGYCCGVWLLCEDICVVVVFVVVEIIVFEEFGVWFVDVDDCDVG